MHIKSSGAGFEEASSGFWCGKACSARSLTSNFTVPEENGVYYALPNTLRQKQRA